jgi:hypothetical protein
MSGKRNSTYSGDAWTLNYGGLQLESGKGPDEFISSEHIAEERTLTVGIDGESCFNIIIDTSRKISVTFMFTSKANALLSTYFNVCRKTEGGLPAPLYLEDRLGTTKEISSAAMIAFMPDFKAAKEVGTVTWEFLAADADTFIGSH